MIELAKRFGEKLQYFGKNGVPSGALRLVGSLGRLLRGGLRGVL